MNRIRFHSLLASNRKFIKLFSFVFILGTFLLTSCAENLSPSNDPSSENSLAFKQSGSNIKASARNPLVSSEPSGNIATPPNDVTVNLGDKVYFSGGGFDPTGNYPMSFFWNFAGIQPNGLTQNPGFVTMNRVGTYRVELLVTNGIGISDSSREVRVITVIDPASNTTDVPTATNPISSIDSPIGNLTINVGESVNFLGSGNSPIGNDPVSYFWNFSGAMPNSTSQNPGVKIFSQPGVYPISLSVTDQAGVSSANNALVTITVRSEGTANLAPSASIISPPGDLAISAGDSIFFTGSASDADANNPLQFNWDFTGAAANSTEATPGKITFANAGVYVVRLTVTDALGLADPNPPVRIITVADVAPQSNMPLSNVIVSPANDITINIGESINFQGESNNGSLDGPLRYLWQLDDLGMPPSTLQNPGEIVFDNIGEFEVKLIIGDANGDIVSHEVERKIIVIDPTALQVHVHEPATNLTINAGEIITFTPMVIFDPMGSGNYSYQWDFDGAATDSNLSNPAPVTFNVVGLYKIKLLIRDPLTNRMAKAKPRLITVVDPSALQARIVSPNNNQIISVGESINFAGEGFDPLDTAVLEFLWKFDGVTTVRAVQNPGQIIFSTPGEFDVSLMVRDPLTLRKTRARSMQITVLDQNVLVAEITSPSNDKLLFLGESIDFAGIGMDPQNDATILSYQWTFGRGGISSQQNPGLFTYDIAGKYEVEFHVDDPLTNRHSNKIERRIYVMPDAPAGPVVTMLKGTITSPTEQVVTIAAGDIVVFEALGYDPAGMAGLMFNWDFDGGALSSTAQNPGAVMFSTPGVYIITMMIENAAGEKDQGPPSVIMIVL